ncbi:MAG TPA: histidinol dehydrogenase [Solirubrobacteraceae bacterium]|nr:histidinol dehydrogenase [Solirubrobacteraceae bacterium]
MRIERLAIAGDPAGAARHARSLQPPPASVEPAVRDIIAAVREGGDRAVRELTARLDTGGAEPPSLRVTEGELADALAALDPAVRAGLDTAVTNVALVADAGRGEDREVRLPQGHTVTLREVPVRRAAIYVPGGRSPYPSAVVMGVVTARAAGVEDVAVCTPPGHDGDAHPVILAACALIGVTEVYRMGGAQAVAALSLGTEAVPCVDVMAGPGTLYVQEAKRQLSGEVGIDGFFGPSDLLAVCDRGADPHLLALDLLAQAEHGEGSLVAGVCDDDAMLDLLEAELAAGAARHPHVVLAPCVLAEAGSLLEALAFAEQVAPEHLQLAGAGAEALTGRVRAAGCVLVGQASGTAFSDYVAGSNHTLPTAGAARFASGLGPRTFRRRVSEVRIADAAGALAPAGAAVARAEGMELHAESMEARISEDGTRR